MTDSNTEKLSPLEKGEIMFMELRDLGTSNCFANTKSIGTALCEQKKQYEEDINKYQKTIQELIELCENCPKLIEQKKQIREQLGFIIQRRIDDLEIRVGLGIAIFNLKMVLKEFDEMRL